MKKPSQDPAPGARGGGAPASPNVGGPCAGDALPIRKGWGSRAFRRLRELEADTALQKAVEWILVIVLGLSWLVSVLLPLVV